MVTGMSNAVARNSKDALQRRDVPTGALVDLYRRVRMRTGALASSLSDADATVQSMPDASPAKWHLAHTSWFFEVMVLRVYLGDYTIFDERFDYLFNSYYDTIGDRHPRPSRGLLSRPTLDQVLAYRRHVDDGMERLMSDGLSSEAAGLVELGCHHEQQHQELLLTDILHLFSGNPLRPAHGLENAPVSMGRAAPSRFRRFEGGLVDIGAGGADFAFDAEGPQHRILLEPFELAERLVTNRDWKAFIDDCGYEDARLWLSDGWAAVREQHWQAPLYWEPRGDEIWSMTLAGMRRLDLDAPVAHVSYYEADAFATWSGMRLPTEFEWEHAASSASTGLLRATSRSDAAAGDRELHQMFGSVWQWTRSAFAPYPRFRPSAGAAGEYNGKFMSGQYVLRGGSCVTPDGHSRATYRNFFPPTARWQFTGLRLARDVADAG